MKLILMWPETEQKSIIEGGMVYLKKKNICTLPHFSRYRACCSGTMLYCTVVALVESMLLLG